MPTAGTASAASGVISLVLLTASLVLGVAVGQRRQLPALCRYPSRKLHEYASMLALGFLVLHILAAVAEPFGRVRWIAVFVPFVPAAGRLWLGLGAVSFDLLTALVLTSLLRRRIGRRTWRLVHWTSYACWPAAEAHSLGLGAEMRSGRLLDLAVGCLVAVTAAASWRVLGRRRGSTRRPRPISSP
jgi:sulfoxide reductase heme-binding subunit YedZ